MRSSIFAPHGQFTAVCKVVQIHLVLVCFTLKRNFPVGISFLIVYFLKRCIISSIVALWGGTAIGNNDNAGLLNQKLVASTNH